MDELILQAKNGDNQAVSQIASQYKGLVLSVANRFYLVGGNKDDLLQEGMIGLYYAVKNFDETKGAFPAFVELCVRSQIKSAITRSNAEKHRALNDYVDITALEGVEDDSNPLDYIVQKENFEKLLQIVSAKLSKQESKVLKLFAENHSYDDISATLGISYKSVDGALQRARKKLIAILQQKEQEK